MQGTLLASAISPDNTPHGYNLTFAFPMLLFIIVAGLLYLRFSRSHKVPGHVALASSRWATTSPGAAKVHSEALAAEPVAAVVVATEPAHGATAAESTAEESTAVATSAEETQVQESATQEGTEDSE